MTLQQWLEKEFYPVVDRNRLERGKKLYNSGKLVDLKDSEEGFFATVRGSGGKAYQIDAFLPVDDEGVPDIEEIVISCSCPDWAEFCKHTVCALMGYCLEQEALHSATATVFNETAREVKKTLKDDMETIYDLTPIPLLRESGRLEQMHRTVAKKLRNHTF